MLEGRANRWEKSIELGFSPEEMGFKRILCHSRVMEQMELGASEGHRERMSSNDRREIQAGQGRA